MGLFSRFRTKKEDKALFELYIFKNKAFTQFFPVCEFAYEAEGAQLHCVITRVYEEEDLVMAQEADLEFPTIVEGFVSTFDEVEEAEVGSCIGFMLKGTYYALIPTNKPLSIVVTSLQRALFEAEYRAEPEDTEEDRELMADLVSKIKTPALRTVMRPVSKKPVKHATTGIDTPHMQRKIRIDEKVEEPEVEKEEFVIVDTPEEETRQMIRELVELPRGIAGDVLGDVRCHVFAVDDEQMFYPYATNATVVFTEDHFYVKEGGHTLTHSVINTTKNRAAYIPERLTVIMFLESSPSVFVLMAFLFESLIDYSSFTDFIVGNVEHADDAWVKKGLMGEFDDEYLQDVAHEFSDFDAFDFEDEEDDEAEMRREMFRTNVAAAREAEGKPEHGNTALTSCLTSPTNYVFRDGQLGRFKVGHEGIASETVLDLGGYFEDGEVAKHTLLQNAEHDILVVKDTLTDRIGRLNLEVGEVVDVYETEGRKVKQIFPMNKFAQREATSIFAGVSHNSVFVMDDRVDSRSKVVQEMTKDYKTKGIGFACAATTVGGGIVVGSRTGEIRMFSKFGQMAKTLLPGLGDAITHIDVTPNGNYVLATTNTYLLIIDTRFEHTTRGGKTSVKTGFAARMGDAKPVPIKLQLTIPDMQALECQVHFTPARFDTSDAASGTRILTSTGEFLLVWNLKDVLNPMRKGLLRSNTRDYVVRKMAEQVVDGSFVYNQPDKVVSISNNSIELSKMHVRPR
ncbi:hypothetical protein PCE1_004250 [Barthelona sp. PCE]